MKFLISLISFSLQTWSTIVLNERVFFRFRFFLFVGEHTLLLFLGADKIFFDPDYLLKSCSTRFNFLNSNNLMTFTKYCKVMLSLSKVFINETHILYYTSFYTTSDMKMILTFSEIACKTRNIWVLLLANIAIKVISLLFKLGWTSSCWFNNRLNPIRIYLW